MLFARFVKEGHQGVLWLIHIHGDRYGTLSRGQGPVQEMATVAIWGQRSVLRDRDLCPSVCSVNFLHSITIAKDQSGGNPPGEGSESVPLYVNKPLHLK